MKALLALVILVMTPLAIGSPIPEFPFLFVGGHASEDVPTARARITFSIENEKFYAGNLRDVKKRLRVAAMKDARENAETLAEASGTALGAIHSISEHDYSELGELIGAETYNPPNLPPGRNEVYEVPPTVRESFYVRVLYRLADTPNNKAPQAGAGQPVTGPAAEPEGGDKPQLEAEGRSR